QYRQPYVHAMKVVADHLIIRRGPRRRVHAHRLLRVHVRLHPGTRGPRPRGRAGAGEHARLVDPARRPLRDRVPPRRLPHARPGAVTADRFTVSWPGRGEPEPPGLHGPSPTIVESLDGGAVLVGDGARVIEARDDLAAA